jgi:lactate racemase
MARVGARTARLDFMVALESHRVMSEQGIDSLFGIGPGERETVFRGMRILNHRWDIPGSFMRMGTISEREIESFTHGLFRESVDVVINRAVYDYDLVLILGPVFPHEVVEFSGGDFLHFFHLLGAAMLAVPRWCLAMVAAQDGALAGLYAGTPEEAWSGAADLSARLHIVYKDRPYATVLGRAPTMYDELWNAGKVMYKLEPIVQDGGTLIIDAPHVKEISHTWGSALLETGYHVRDWFLSRMEQFRHIPRGVLAHSTHVRGIGTVDNGVEMPRIEETCRRVTLVYRDPRSIDIQEFRNREAEGVLFVDHAGEILHRLAADGGAT